jgi:hypothetical protein
VHGAARLDLVGAQAFRDMRIELRNDGIDV